MMNFATTPDQKPLILAHDSNSHQPSYVADYILRDATVSVFTRTETKKGMNGYTYPTPRKTTVTSRMQSIFSHLSTLFHPNHTNSIYGPTVTSKQRFTFIMIIVTMSLCGMISPFSTKISYQSLSALSPLIFDNAYNVIWFGWIFTVGCEAICTFAIIPGWEHGEQWKKVKSEWKPFWRNIFLAGSLGVCQDCGKYISLVFLPVSVATIMKNGSQLMFSALFRKWIEKKTLSKTQTFGIVTVTLGLICVCVASFLSDNKTTAMDNVVGILLLITAAFCGSVRNHYEQILCRDMQYNAYFVVGMREIPAFFWLGVVGLFLFILQPTIANNFFVSAFSFEGFSVGFFIGFCLFLLTVYGKNVTQMRVIELSSALTRNLTMQLMPFGTWIVSLMIHSIYNKQFGERWNEYSWLQLIGFLIVLFGSYCYMKVPPQRRPIIANGMTSIQTGTTKLSNYVFPEMMYTRGSVSSTSYQPYAMTDLDV